ncbi:MAG TPA: thrombospondin type 3 repeat-containing protein [Polyangiaceae bacterium]|nr:thrombospondin type 3 repeat-containing protein [Polyangiaceae bacterium]
MRCEITGFFFFMLLTLRVSAEELFPGAIQQAADIPCAPTCLLCHTEIPGNIANLKQPFGLTVLRSGVKPGDPSSMYTVVANLRANRVDTDGDGKLDVDELAAGTDPNTQNPNAELCGPLYGCGARVASSPLPERRPLLYWLPGALALTVFFSVRRRRAFRRATHCQD